MVVFSVLAIHHSIMTWTNRNRTPFDDVVYGMYASLNLMMADQHKVKEDTEKRTREEKKNIQAIKISVITKQTLYNQKRQMYFLDIVLLRISFCDLSR